MSRDPRLWHNETLFKTRLMYETEKGRILLRVGNVPAPPSPSPFLLQTCFYILVYVSTLPASVYIFFKHHSPILLSLIFFFSFHWKSNQPWNFIEINMLRYSLKIGLLLNSPMCWDFCKTVFFSSPELKVDFKGIDNIF